MKHLVCLPPRYTYAVMRFPYSNKIIGYGEDMKHRQIVAANSFDNHATKCLRFGDGSGSIDEGMAIFPTRTIAFCLAFLPNILDRGIAIRMGKIVGCVNRPSVSS